MLIDLIKVFRVLKKNGAVVHLGAHHAEERDLYLGLGLTPRIWVEAQGALANELKRKLQDSADVVIHNAVWHTPGMTIRLNVSNNSQSSSIYSFGTHKHRYPDTHFIGHEECTTVTLDSILQKVKEPIALVNLDIQGAELPALKGAGHLLSSVPMIYTEVNFEHLYEGCALVGEIDTYLSRKGYRRLVTARQGRDGWGDALYVRASEVSPLIRMRFLFLQATLGAKQAMGAVHRLLRNIP